MKGHRCMMGSVGSCVFVRLLLERESGNESVCCLKSVGQQSQRGSALLAEMKGNKNKLASINKEELLNKRAGGWTTERLSRAVTHTVSSLTVADCFTSRVRAGRPSRSL